MNRIFTLLFLMASIALCLDAAGQTATAPSTASPAIYPPQQPIPVTPKPVPLAPSPTGPMLLTNTPAVTPPNIMAPTPVSAKPAGTPSQ